MTAIIWSIEITGRRGDLRTKFLMVWRLCLIGIGSGAAMIPHAMIKEANPHKVKGSAPGAINFLVFSFNALLAPVFAVALMRFFGGKTLNLLTFHEADFTWVGAIVLSLILNVFPRETAAGARHRLGSLAIRAF
jgi:hypothetical protein